MTDDYDLPGVTDADLVGRVVRSGQPVKRDGAGIYRRTRVADTFALGSTYSERLCHRFGVDPFERVRR